MIYLFDKLERLIATIGEDVLLSWQFRVKNNDWDQASFELPVDYAIEPFMYFGFFHKDAFKLFKVIDQQLEDSRYFKGLDKAESDLHTIAVIKDRRQCSSSAAESLAVILEGTGYQVGSVSGLSELRTINFYYISPREALVKLVETYGCEFSVRYTFVKNKITSRYIDLAHRFGQPTGKQFEHGNNLLKVVYEESTDDIVTCLIGRGKGEPSPSGDGYGRRIEFTDIVWSQANGDPTDKPRGQNFIALDKAKETYGLSQNGVLKHRWGVFVNEDIEDKSALLKATWRELQRLSVPLRIYKADILSLGLDASKGDTVAIIYDDVGIAFEARIDEISYDKLNEDSSTVILGDYSSVQNRESTSRRQAIERYTEEFIHSNNQSIQQLYRELEERIVARNRELDDRFRLAELNFDNFKLKVEAKVEVFKSELTSRLDNQLLPVASEAKGLALKAQAALVQSQAELQGLTKELTNHRQTALAQIAQVKAQSLSQGQQQAALTTQVENAVSGLATFKQTVHQELATFNRLTETVKGRIDQVESQSEQTAAGFKTSLKALETYTALEPTRASRYFEASKTETARQLTALRTEVSGSYVAKSTYEENARGVARRFESLSSGGQNYALGTDKDVYVTVSSDGLFDLYDFGATLAVKGVSVGDTLTLAFNYFTTNKTAFGSYEIELHGHSGKIQRLGEVERTVLGRGTYQVSFVANSTNYLGTSLKIRFTASQLTFRVTKLRLTKGSIAADWSPSPDDLKAYSDQKLTQFRSQFEQTSSEIKANVESLSNQTLKKADVSITSDGIVLKAGKSTSDMARAIGSSFAVTPDAIRIFSNLIKVSGDMLVDGSITSRKLVTGAVETGHIKAGAITGYLLSAEAVSAKHVKVDQALFTKLFANEAYVRQLFAKTAFITQVQAVDISANRVKGGLLAAINGATKFNLNTGALDFYTDSPALRRVLSGYPTQFIRFTTGTSNGKKTGVTIIGSNRNGTESSNDGGFVGVRCWNGNNIDQIDIVGDVVRLASSAFDNSDGWSVKTLPGKLEIDAHRSSDRPSSKLNIGDVNLFRTATNYTSLKDILQQFNINFKHLANITGRGDVISTWETIK
ncbi:prophage LambdaSa2, PblB [Streptococcus varani]|uniref:Prophage LambdaSa2, PblB n=1 Tax=Streptococcus varani TaxID=1608583 RepID=A0A0E4CRZ0_9STRE|nr:phage tail spike protein [Streptococcus varani]CQR23934.1 prophage LambdaSa2, PblB [Streptococcus varani]